MKCIKVLSLEESLVIDPPENAIMIRILGPKFLKFCCGGVFPPMHYSQKFQKVLCYEFDDFLPNEEDYFDCWTKLFDKNEARQIITDFKGLYPISDCLFVHCNKGISRSSAVAASLNHIFVMGFRDEEFLDRTKHSPNIHVYDTMIQTAKEMGIVFGYFRTGQGYFL